jgi:hypothetical protein
MFGAALRRHKVVFNILRNMSSYPNGNASQFDQLASTNITESTAGICRYLTDVPGFQGILKQVFNFYRLIYFCFNLV